MPRWVAPGITLALLAVVPATAHASVAPSVPTGDILGIGHAILGGLSFTADFFKDVITALLGGVADMLIPDSWATKGTELLTWLVAVPNFTQPAFSDLRGLSHVSLWLGLVTLPTTLAISITLPQLGLTAASDTPGAIFGRTAAAAIGLVLWATLWSQGAALANQVSSAYLGAHLAVQGMNAYMQLIAVGGALGGVPILGILVVLFAGAVFLGALVMKVMVLLIGGLLFVSGPVLLGVVPTQRGAQLARLWVTTLLSTWALPIVWGLVFVTSGVFIHRAPAIGAALGGPSSIAATGGTLVAGCAAIVGPLLCIALTRSALGPLGGAFAAATSAASPRRAVQRLANGSAASPTRLGSVGGGARSVSSSSSPGAAAGASAMHRLALSRVGAAQAARGFASSASASGATPGASYNAARLSQTTRRTARRSTSPVSPPSSGRPERRPNRRETGRSGPPTASERTPATTASAGSTPRMPPAGDGAATPADGKRPLNEAGVSPAIGTGRAAAASTARRATPSVTSPAASTPARRKPAQPRPATSQPAPTKPSRKSPVRDTGRTRRPQLPRGRKENR